MKADYKNWIPKGMVTAFGAGAATLAAGAVVLGAPGRGTLARAFSAVCGLGAAVLCAGTVWSVAAYRAFSYEGTRKLSKRIVRASRNTWRCRTAGAVWTWVAGAAR